MRPEKLLTIKSSPCETSTGELRCDLFKDGEQFVLRCIYRYGDCKFPKPAKPVVRWKVKLDPQQVNPLLDRLRKAKIPAMPQFEYGCDGEIAELSLGDYMGSASYRWWSIAPKGWEELEEVHYELMKLADLDKTIT